MSQFELDKERGYPRAKSPALAALDEILGPVK